MTETYVQQARAALLAELATVDPGWAPGERLLDLYTLLVLTKGTACTSQDVHDAWAADAARDRPGHPDLVPFENLSPEVAAYDDRYRDAIHAATAALDARAA
jgi:hypothetical protein